MLIDNVYIVLLICLFIFTGVQSTIREITIEKNTPLNISFDTIEYPFHPNEIKPMLLKYEYLHSIWVYTLDDKRIILDDKELPVPQSFSQNKTLWIKNAYKSKQNTTTWGTSFEYTDNAYTLILTPYYKRIKTGIVACMFAFYI